MHDKCGERNPSVYITELLSIPCADWVVIRCRRKPSTGFVGQQCQMPRVTVKPTNWLLPLYLVLVRSDADLAYTVLFQYTKYFRRAVPVLYSIPGSYPGHVAECAKDLARWSLEIIPQSCVYAKINFIILLFIYLFIQIKIPRT